MPNEPDEFDLIPETGPWTATRAAKFETSPRQERSSRSPREIVRTVAILIGAALIGMAFIGWTG